MNVEENEGMRRRDVKPKTDHNKGHSCLLDPKSRFWDEKRKHLLLDEKDLSSY